MVKTRAKAAQTQKKNNKQHTQKKSYARNTHKKGSVLAPQDCVIEGRNAVKEALLSDVPMSCIYVMRAKQEDKRDHRLVELIDMARSRGIRTATVDRALLDATSARGSHQGVIAQTKPYVYATLPQILQRAQSQNELIVVLDHITDEGNFGAIIRSAEIVGAAGIVIPKARAARVTGGVYKTSAGAALHIPIAQVPNLAQALCDIKAHDFWVGGASEHAEQDVWHAPVQGRFALVMGAEGSGISDLVQKRCDFLCALPQTGKTESLNVAQATTVMCYEWLRRKECAHE